MILTRLNTPTLNGVFTWLALDFKSSFHDLESLLQKLQRLFNTCLNQLSLRQPQLQAFYCNALVHFSISRPYPPAILFCQRFRSFRLFLIAAATLPLHQLLTSGTCNYSCSVKYWLPQLDASPHEIFIPAVLHMNIVGTSCMWTFGHFSYVGLVAVSAMPDLWLLYLRETWLPLQWETRSPPLRKTFFTSAGRLCYVGLWSLSIRETFSCLRYKTMVTVAMKLLLLLLHETFVASVTCYLRYVGLLVVSAT